MTPDVSKLQSLVTALDNELTNVYAQYVALHDGFNAYRGSVLNDGTIEEVNNLIRGIHEKYRELYPVYDWIHSRKTVVTNVAKGFDDWMNELEAAGARNVEDDSH